MRAVFGIVSLLVALAVVAFVAKSQLSTRPVAGNGAIAQPRASVASDARTIEDKARDDVTRALQEGARRIEDADRR